MKTFLSVASLILALACHTIAANQNLILPGVSTGVLGPLVVNAHTNIVLPPDGRLNFTTITIHPGVGLTFTRNAANTPVYLLAQGDVLINGTITLSGEEGTPLRGGFGGPGGFDGGMPGISGGEPGDGYGPGAGRGGSADGTIPGGGGAYANRGGQGFPTPSSRNGATYGSQLLLPLVGGSGGGGSPNRGGSGGGGAILIASSTRIELNSSISSEGARSAEGVAGAGSGGAIRLVAPVIAGTGGCSVDGGPNPILNTNNNGGAGRIRCDAMDRTGFNLGFNPNFPAVPANPMATPPTPAIPEHRAAFTADQYLPLLFPPNGPTLRVVSVGGIAIPPGAPAGYSVTLPLNSAASQPVVVEAENFGTPVDITVKVTPATGPALPGVNATIDNSTANPATTSVSVQLPANVPVTVNAWTR